MSELRVHRPQSHNGRVRGKYPAMPRVLRLLPKAAVYALNALWAVPAVLLLRALRPWILVRVGPLRCERIGHFVIDAVLQLAERETLRERRRTVDLAWFPDAPANEQWAAMVRRTFVVGWWVRYLISFNRRIPGNGAHEFGATNYSRDVRGLLAKTSARIDFLPEENERAISWLRKRGWRDGDPFVCLLVRDSTYLSTHALHKHIDYSYHAYRDSDIGDFAEAAQALLDKGYWVIRMGKVMRERVPLDHPRLVDYPFVDDQDDLLDIWLSAHCAFFISTGTGLDTVAVAYARPVVFVNVNPFGNVYSFADSITVPKHLVWRSSGKLLKLSEHFDAHFSYAHEYDCAGIDIKGLSSAEIAAVVLEGELRFSGKWLETERDSERQRRFWQSLRRWPRFHEFHGFIHPRARVGRDWLAAMGDAFLE